VVNTLVEITDLKCLNVELAHVFFVLFL
jgi:hypothetical protein